MGVRPKPLRSEVATAVLVLISNHWFCLINWPIVGKHRFLTVGIDTTGFLYIDCLASIKD